MYWCVPAVYLCVCVCLLQVMETERMIYLVTEYASGGEIFGESSFCGLSFLFLSSVSLIPYLSPPALRLLACPHCHSVLPDHILHLRSKNISASRGFCLLLLFHLSLSLLPSLSLFLSSLEIGRAHV